MKFLTERVQESIRLTSNQKAIIATIVAAPNKAVADDILASNANLSGALEQLVNMGMVKLSDEAEQDDHYTTTDLGIKYGTEASILDDMGQLTEVGTEVILGDNRTNESVGTFKDYLKLI